jgi:hypothetical protein
MSRSPRKTTPVTGAAPVGAAVAHASMLSPTRDSGELTRGGPRTAAHDVTSLLQCRLDRFLSPGRAEYFAQTVASIFGDTELLDCLAALRPGDAVRDQALGATLPKPSGTPDAGEAVEWLRGVARGVVFELPRLLRSRTNGVLAALLGLARAFSSASGMVQSWRLLPSKA